MTPSSFPRSGASGISRRFIWQHALAIGVAPLYVEQNGEAVRADWPRIPLPSSEQLLRESVGLGRQVATLLNVVTPVTGVDTGPIELRLQSVAAIGRADGKPLNPDSGDLVVTSGWGIVQQRAVMPGAGKYEIRKRTVADNQGLDADDCDLLGDQVLDIYLNADVCWSGVPAAVWDYKIGGFQVLRKWLSYREKRALGRDLTTAEVRAFITIARRLTALVLLGPALDTNYLNVTDAPSPGQLAAF